MHADARKLLWDALQAAVRKIVLVPYPIALPPT
jgi:predicted AlkP superfamily phosphohydrolase/phosphomutase